jgi:hypothetical protein
MKAKDEFNYHRHRLQNCALFIPKVQEAWMRRSIDVLLGIQGNIIRYLKKSVTAMQNLCNVWNASFFEPK